MPMLLMLLWFHIVFGASSMIRVLLSALLGLQLRLSYLVIRRPEIWDRAHGIGVYFNPEEGQEMMTGFDDVLSGLQKRGSDLKEDESEGIRQLLYADAISPQFVKKLVQDYGDASIAAAFLIPQDRDKYYVEYLLRRYKGHFYRNRYPSLTIVDT
jgi:hypothetical protein